MKQLRFKRIKAITKWKIGERCVVSSAHWKRLNQAVVT